MTIFPYDILKSGSPRVLVVGDVMLDEYIHGTAERISPESPVPVLEQTHRTYDPGGAGNVAMNLLGLGARVTLLGVCGRDQAGTELKRILREAGVNISGLLTVNRATTAKTRITADSHQLFRIDREERALVDQKTTATLRKKIYEFLKTADAIIISDYAKGVMTKTLSETIMKRAHTKNIPVVVDAKPSRMTLYRNASVITPNIKEAAHITGIDSGDVPAMAQRLKTMMRANVIITQGEKGMTLFPLKGKSRRFPPEKVQKIYNVIGAGDTVVATLGYALARGVTLDQATFLANLAGGIVVGKLGTARITFHELENALVPQRGKIKSAKELASIVKAAKNKGKTVVLITGCFDVLHSGHIDLFNKARRLGDILVVAANSDASIKKIKGPKRPIISEKYRLFNLASLMHVDYVTTFSEPTPKELVKKLKPNVFVKGGDWRGKKLPERDAVKSVGGEIIFVPIVIPLSTTDVARKIHDS